MCRYQIKQHGSPFKDTSSLQLIQLQSNDRRYLKIYHVNWSCTGGRHKYDHIMNIRSESDCDRDHKPSKLVHSSYEGHKNIILPLLSTSLLWQPSPPIYMSRRASE